LYKGGDFAPFFAHSESRSDCLLVRSETINFSTVMKLKTTELIAMGTSGVVNAHANDIGVEDDILQDTIPIRLSISPFRDDFKVIGNLSVPVHKSCDRCLVEYEEDINAKFEIVVISHDSPLSESDDADLIVLNPGQHEVDLGPFIRDAIEIEHHIKNLCKKNCKGICPQCGVNLNNKECACSEKLIDERWKPVSKMKLSTTEN